MECQVVENNESFVYQMTQHHQRNCLLDALKTFLIAGEMPKCRITELWNNNCSLLRNSELIIGVDSGHFLFELNDRQNSRFVYTTLKSYHKASAQVLSNLRSSSSGFSWTTDTHISPGFLLSWSWPWR